MGRHEGFIIDRWRTEPLTGYAGRKIPELDWWSVNSTGYVYHAAAKLNATSSVIVLEDKPIAGSIFGYHAEVRYPGNGAWHQYFNKKIRIAALGCLAKYLDGQEYWTRFLELEGAWWRRSKWKRDMRQLEQEIFAQVLGLPKPSIEAGALSLTQDTRGGLSLAQEVVE